MDGCAPSGLDRRFVCPSGRNGVAGVQGEEHRPACDRAIDLCRVECGAARRQGLRLRRLGCPGRRPCRGRDPVRTLVRENTRGSLSNSGCRKCCGPASPFPSGRFGIPTDGCCCWRFRPCRPRRSSSTGRRTFASGNATPRLTDHPERQQALRDKLRPYAWETGIARQFAEGAKVLALLEYPSCFDLLGKPMPESREAILAGSRRREADLARRGREMEHSQPRRHPVRQRHRRIRVETLTQGDALCRVRRGHTHGRP